MLERQREVIPLKDRIKGFIIDWTKFPIDLWWRRRYNVPFGSKAHREMNFIDMAIDFQETLYWNKIANENPVSREYQDEEEYINSQINISDEKIVKMSQEEIDKDYEEFDLENFNVK